MADEDRPRSRERLVEEFGEEFVRETEWWADEMGRVENVQAAILESVRYREDVQVARRGRSVDRDGRHEVRFRLIVAGEPYEEGEDGA